MECRTWKEYHKTGSFLPRKNYDTPGSVRGCRCKLCVKSRNFWAQNYKHREAP